MDYNGSKIEIKNCNGKVKDYRNINELKFGCEYLNRIINDKRKKIVNILIK